MKKRTSLLTNTAGRAIGHAPRTATGAESAPLAAERQQMLGATGVAAQAQESVLQPPALQVAIEGLPHMAGELLSGIGQVLDKGRIMALDSTVSEGSFCLTHRAGKSRNLTQPPPISFPGLPPLQR